MGGFFTDKKSFSAQEKYELIVAFENRNDTTLAFCRKHNISKYTMYQWIQLFQTYGIEGLKRAKGWKGYSEEVKTSAIVDYLSGNFSSYEIIRKYEISSRSVLEKWVKNYNNHRVLKETTQRTGNSMAKGKSTTLKEKIEIVKHCLENGKDYNQTAQQFGVSYQQVYQWTKKYMEKGQAGLEDNRGRRKDEKELTPEEKTQRDMEQLKQENERLRAELAFLKKLEEIERRGHR